MKDLKDKTIKGISWNGLASAVNQIVTLAVGIYLARLLEPSDFGLLAMVLVVTGFANVLKDMGFSSALIQRKETNQRQLSSVFWLNMGFGTFLTLFFVLMAPLIAKFYEKPALTMMVYVMAFNYIFASAIQVHVVLFKRALDFKKIAIINTLVALLSGVIAIVMAYNGWGVWALVTKSMLVSMLGCLFYWTVSKWRPKLVYDWEEIKALLNFSLNLMGTRSFHYWTRKLDDILIGKFIGDIGLGLYSRAYSFLMMPLNAIKSQIVSVAFPALSKIQDDKERVKKIVLKVSATLAMIIYPIMLGLLVVAGDFVLLLLGEKWMAMIPVLQVFCITSMSQAINFPSVIYLSQGRADLHFRVGIFTKCFHFSCIIIGLYWGILGVAIGITIASFINFFPTIFFAGRLVNLRPVEILKAVGPFLLIGGTMSGTVYLAGMGMQALLWPSILAFIVKIMLGGLVYLLLLLLFKPKPTEELFGLVQKLLKRKEA